jgi:hypothetical protein
MAIWSNAPWLVRLASKRILLSNCLAAQVWPPEAAAAGNFAFSVLDPAGAIVAVYGVISEGSKSHSALWTTFPAGSEVRFRLANSRTTYRGFRQEAASHRLILTSLSSDGSAAVPKYAVL